MSERISVARTCYCLSSLAQSFSSIVFLMPGLVDQYHFRLIHSKAQSSLLRLFSASKIVSISLHLVDSFSQLSKSLSLSFSYTSFPLFSHHHLFGGEAHSLPLSLSLSKASIILPSVSPYILSLSYIFSSSSLSVVLLLLRSLSLSHTHTTAALPNLI